MGARHSAPEDLPDPENQPAHQILRADEALLVFPGLRAAAGSVVAVDSSSEQLQVAARSAAAAGRTNISFREANAYETGLPQRFFDLVYSRFLLCHVAGPAKALAEMRSLLKPGGILVCEDHDNGGIFTEPPTQAYKRLVEISDAVNRTRGLDSYVGLKLPGMFRAVGFPRPDVRVNQIAFLRGAEKRFWEITLREAEPSIVATGASTAAELESVCGEMRTVADEESILLMLARVTQVWASTYGRAESLVKILPFSRITSAGDCWPDDNAPRRVKASGPIRILVFIGGMGDLARIGIILRRQRTVGNKRNRTRIVDGKTRH